MTWFSQIFDAEAMRVVATRLGAELAQRISGGTPTLEDLFRVSEALNRNPIDLLPASFDDLDRPGDDLLRRDFQRSA
ncbi:hypothetical protein AB0L82_17665 [Nocardia sp. NPDC052001]|uniref:hypothetical protein n=1 Tax=Nocardia sp. NPDC052001 TaxID=3154853 RepID=UPI003432AA22